MGSVRETIKDTVIPGQFLECLAISALYKVQKNTQSGQKPYRKGPFSDQHGKPLAQIFLQGIERLMLLN